MKHDAVSPPTPLGGMKPERPPRAGEQLESYLDDALEERRSDVSADWVASDPYPGLVVDQRYVVEHLLAEGGMGRVYQCRHRVLDKKLAMKIIRADIARMPEATQRFLIEAKAASAIGNEHIIDISDFGTLRDGSAYLVMELLEGQALTRLLDEQPSLPLERIVSIASQIAEGLAAAHRAGIIHRDLKPGNVFLVPRQGIDFVKIVDFGVAKIAHGPAKLTQAGTIVGTPHYMAPEQASGAAVDHRADIYALGVILYELIAGRVPFDADHYVAVLHQHLHDVPPSLRSFNPAVEVPAALKAVICRCLAKRPRERYPDMDALLLDLHLLAMAPVGPVAAAEGVAASGGAASVGVGERQPTLVLPAPDAVAPPRGEA